MSVIFKQPDSETFRNINETIFSVTKAFSPAQLFHLADFNQVLSAEWFFKAESGCAAVVL